MMNPLRKFIALSAFAGGLFASNANALEFERPQPYEGSWYNFPLGSKHTNTYKDHNERNWGFGIERYVFGRNWQAGAYRNSQYRRTAYVMTELTYIEISDRLRLRFNAGLVTGYQYPITPVVLPVWTYDAGRWGFDVMTIPPIGKRMGIFALQLKVKF